MKSELLILCACSVFIQLDICLGQRRRLVITCKPIKLSHGRVKIRARAFAEFICAKGYILAGERYNKCTQGEWESSPPVCVRPNCQKPQKLKNGVTHSSHLGGVINFYCLANYVLEGPKQAFCVDMKWNTHLPSCMPTNTTASLSCDFESEDLCGWSQDLNHNFDWTRKNHKTPSGHLATGPSYDHTKGSGSDGYYMYIEGSTRNMNDTARLISPIYKKKSNNTCLEFYYHMYGSGIGQLRVYLKKINETWDLNVDDAIFLKNGNQGNEWWRAFVELGAIEEQFQVVIEGVRGFSFVSDIAIDDVKIIENCNTDISTTTEMETEETTFIYDSCADRCNTTSLPQGCACDENCADNNACCPDYIAVCILDNDTFVTETTITTSSVGITTFLTHIPVFTTPKVTLPPPTIASTTTKLSNFTAKLLTINPMLLPQTTLKSLIPRVEQKDISTLTQPITTQVTISPTKKTTIAQFFYNDMLTVPIATSSTEEEIIVRVTEVPIEPHKEYPDHGLTHPSLLDKVAPVQEKPIPSNKTTAVAILAVCLIIVGVLGLIFFVRRYTNKRWMSVRRMRNGNGDSQSDVRFLTSDEILDFRVAVPSNKYN